MKSLLVMLLLCSSSLLYAESCRLKAEILEEGVCHRQVRYLDLKRPEDCVKAASDSRTNQVFSLGDKGRVIQAKYKFKNPKAKARGFIDFENTDICIVYPRWCPKAGC